MLSCPVLFLGLRDLIRLSIPSGSVGDRYIDLCEALDVSKYESKGFFCADIEEANLIPILLKY